MSNSSNSLNLTPWYRQGWPWFLISFPLVSVVLGIGMIVLSVQTNNSLVVDDYYKEGKAINQRIERDQLASELGLSAELWFNSAEGTVLSLSRNTDKGGNNDFSWPEALTVNLVHSTHARLDQQHQFAHIGAGRYIDNTHHWPSQGRWRIHVQSSREALWRLVSDTIMLGQGNTIVIEAVAQHG